MMWAEMLRGNLLKMNQQTQAKLWFRRDVEGGEKEFVAPVLSPGGGVSMYVAKFVKEGDARPDGDYLNPLVLRMEWYRAGSADFNECDDLCRGGF
jgi:hypothetical protein